jgi:protein-disulfide isomerase
MAAVEACLMVLVYKSVLLGTLYSSKYSDKIQKQTSLGSQYGLSGTPTFYIGNQNAGYTQIVGAQPITSFEQLIKQLSGGTTA